MEINQADCRIIHRQAQYTGKMLGNDSIHRLDRHTRRKNRCGKECGMTAATSMGRHEGLQRMWFRQKSRAASTSSTRAQGSWRYCFFTSSSKTRSVSTDCFMRLSFLPLWQVPLQANPETWPSCSCFCSEVRHRQQQLRRLRR